MSSSSHSLKVANERGTLTQSNLRNRLLVTDADTAPSTVGLIIQRRLGESLVASITRLKATSLHSSENMSVWCQFVRRIAVV